MDAIGYPSETAYKMPTQPKKKIDTGFPARLGLGAPARVPTSGASAPSTSAWLTRRQVSDMLNISQTTIIDLERKGRLHPVKGIRMDRNWERSVFLYDPDEVGRIPRRDRGSEARSPGEVCARVYELLDDGATVRQIVVETRESSDRVREIKARWIDDGGFDRVIVPAAWEALEAAIGKFESVTELVERVTALAKANSNKVDGGAA